MSDPTLATQTPGQIIADILAEHEVRMDHSAASLAEAARWLEHPGMNDPQLVDWRALAFVTIDNEDSRDLDQALLIEAQPDGYRVRYALSDAAYYIRPGSSLFADALERGTSFYTPAQAIPMLPRILSEGLVSLNPNQDRRALVFDMQLNADGEPRHTSIVRALIHSQAKLSYHGVQQFLDANKRKRNNPLSEQPYAESLRLLERLGKLLAQNALERDVVPYTRSESQITVQHQPPKFVLKTRERIATEEYNAQISLLCNMQGALLLSGLAKQSDALQAVFRVHRAPRADRLEQLRQQLDSLVKLRGLSDQWLWSANQSLADYVESLPVEHRHERQVAAIERQILVSNRASEFQAEPGRHHALAVPSYARFSSPMREVVGIFTHKELLEALRAGHDTAGNATDRQIEQNINDHELRLKIINVANRARQQQKQIDKAIEFAVIQQVLKRDLHLVPRPERNGTIMGITGNRLYIAIDKFAIDLKVYREDLQNQMQTNYQFNGVQALPAEPDKPTWTLGDGVAVSTHSYDNERRRFLLSLRALSS